MMHRDAEGDAAVAERHVRSRQGRCRVSRDAEIENLKLTIAKMQRDGSAHRSERGAKLLDQLELAARRSWKQASPRTRWRPTDHVRRRDARNTERQQAGAPATARASAARACRASQPARLPGLRRRTAQARRGRHRDAGTCAGDLEGHPARAREVHLPDVRDDLPRRRRRPIRSRAGAPARICSPRSCSTSTARICRSNRQSAIYRRRGRRSRRLDAGRLGRRLRGNADAAGRGHRSSMCLPPNASTPTTRPCRCWPKANAARAGCGPTCATTRRSAGSAAPAALFYYSPDRAAEHPERHLATLHRHLMQADAYSGYNGLYVAETASRARSSRPRAGRMAAQVLRAGRAAIRRRLPSKPSGASTNCSPSNARSTASRRTSALRVRQERSKPLVEDLETWLQNRAREALIEEPDRQGDRLSSQAMARLHALPRRWPHLPVEQRRRARRARHRRRAQQLDLRRLRLRRPARRCDLHADRDLQAQRRRCPRLARRRARPHRRSSGMQLEQLLPWNWKPAST